MQSLPAPAWRLGRARRLASRRLRVAAGVAAAIAVAGAMAWGLAAEGGGSAASAPAAPPPGVALLRGNAMQSADCSAWNASAPADQEAMLTAMQGNVGRGTGYGPAATLTNDRARSIIDNACSQPIAAHWLLYELYIRAAGFQSVAP